MKLAIFLVSLVPLMGWAKISDFNSMITENAKAQKELQTSLESRNKAEADAEQAALAPTDRTVVLESATYVAPTNKKVLRYSKEINQKRPSSKKEMDRLAEEFRSVEREL